LGGSEEAKFWYTYGRLDKKVRSLVAPQLSVAERSKSYRCQDLFEQLARLCENPNAKRDAEDKLGSLRQFPDQSFNFFLGIFERHLYKAEAQNWSDDAKVALLRRQLNDKMKRRLRTQITIPSTYTEFVKILQQLDDGDSHGYSSSQQTYHKPTKAGDPMDIGRIGINSILARHEELEDSEYSESE